MITMAVMPKDETTPTTMRLLNSELRELDDAAKEQPVPVKRAALMSHIVREWLERRRREKKRK